MEKDLDLKMWLEANGWPYTVVASKMDKLNQAEQQRGLKAIRQYAEPLPFSAVTGRGVREIWQAITKTQPITRHTTSGVTTPEKTAAPSRPGSGSR